MKTTHLAQAAVQEAAGFIPEGVGVIMLNLLRYKVKADYGSSAEWPYGSGREVYFQQYIPAFNQVAAALGLQGIQPVYIGTVLAGLVAPPHEQWDDLALVEYPSFAAFRKIVESSEYAAIADPHRRAALDDWRLIATIKKG